MKMNENKSARSDDDDDDDNGDGGTRERSEPVSTTKRTARIMSCNASSTREMDTQTRSHLMKHSRTAHHAQSAEQLLWPIVRAHLLPQRLAIQSPTLYVAASSQNMRHNNEQHMTVVCVGDAR